MKNTTYKKILILLVLLAFPFFLTRFVGAVNTTIGSTSITTGGRLALYGDSPSAIQLEVWGNTSQTENIVKVKSAGGNDYFNIGKYGTATFGRYTPTADTLLRIDNATSEANARGLVLGITKQGQDTSMTVGLTAEPIAATDGDVTMNAMYGISGNNRSSGSANVTNSYSISANIQQYTSGTITNQYNFHSDTGSKGENTTITNMYGLYIEDVTNAINNYGIYVQGANTYALWIDSGNSRFDGNVGTTNAAITLGLGVTAFAATSNVMTITGHGSGNTIATITGGVSGQLLTLIFVDGNVTISNNNDHTANTVDLDASNNFTSADDKVLQLVFDGTSWYKISESTN